MKGSLGAGELDKIKKDNFMENDYAPKTRGQTSSRDRKKPAKLNPKVLETWINETLEDAEHLDIPGVILKSEHKTPVSRYGISRLHLQQAGLNEELIDRIYRALFVYSVGFYELIGKCLEHTNNKYTIIVAIWKVYAILLEYCCRTDYQTMISRIVSENDDEKEKLRTFFEGKFQEQANNEKVLK
jgi:hypothetical protein